jgi:hypothetical protein
MSMISRDFVSFWLGSYGTQTSESLHEPRRELSSVALIPDTRLKCWPASVRYSVCSTIYFRSKSLVDSLS